MAEIATESNLDTLSVDGGNCSFPAQPLGAPFVSPNVKIMNQPARFFSNFPEGSPGDPTMVAGVKVNPFNPTPCPVLPRTLTPVVNKTVHINGMLVAVVGDQSNITGQSPRPIINVGKYPKIILNTKNP